MIRAVGYTDDRQVFVEMVMDLHGTQTPAVMMLSQDAAKRLSGDLTKALEAMDANERDRANPH